MVSSLFFLESHTNADSLNDSPVTSPARSIVSAVLDQHGIHPDYASFVRMLPVTEGLAEPLPLESATFVGDLHLVDGQHLMAVRFRSLSLLLRI